MMNSYYSIKSKSPEKEIGLDLFINQVQNPLIIDNQLLNNPIAYIKQNLVPAFSPNNAGLRTKEAIENHNKQNAIVLDIDHSEYSLEEIKAILNKSIGNYFYIIHSTISHSIEKARFRVFIPLMGHLSINQWLIVQQYFMNKLRADKCALCVSQIYLLPVALKDQCYEYYINQKPILSAHRIPLDKLVHKSVSKPIYVRSDSRADYIKEYRIVTKIERINDSYPINNLLLKYGYKHKGTKQVNNQSCELYIHPDSQSQIPGTVVFPNGHFIEHGTNSFFCDGKRHDSADLICHYRYRNDLNLMLKDLVIKCTPSYLLKGDQNDY